jgi:magnesium-transporting ATPase (P-type)
MPLVPRIQVMVPSSPFDKPRFVQILREEGETVAASGDSVNNVSALRTAGIGPMMGFRNETAKWASAL